MVKFKIGFTVSAETLFGLIAKFLPVEDLQVEELMPKPVQQPRQLPRVASLVNKAEKSKRKPPKPINLNIGINRVIIEVLNDGKPHHASELKPLLKRNGFSPNSVGSRLQFLETQGIVHKIGDGTWELRKSQIKESA